MLTSTIACCALASQTFVLTSADAFGRGRGALDGVAWARSRQAARSSPCCIMPSLPILLHGLKKKTFFLPPARAAAGMLRHALGCTAAAYVAPSLRLSLLCAHGRTAVRTTLLKVAAVLWHFCAPRPSAARRHAAVLFSALSGYVGKRARLGRFHAVDG